MIGNVFVEILWGSWFMNMCLTTGTKFMVVENGAFLFGLVFNMVQFLHRWIVLNYHLAVEIGVYGNVL